MGIIVSFGNSKGGVGKSTMLAVNASYINKTTDLNICVIDADINQRTLARWRRDDLVKSGVDKDVAMDLYDRFSLHKVDYEKYGLEQDDFFHLVISDPKYLPNLLPKLRESYDIIFIDLPGNIGQEGVLTCYGYVDYLFVPTGLYVADTDATFTKYLPAITGELRESRKIGGLDETKIYIFLNKVNKSTKEYKYFIENKDKFKNYDFLETIIPDSKAVFGREVSTVDPVSFTSQGKDVVKDLFNEIMDVMNVKFEKIS